MTSRAITTGLAAVALAAAALAGCSNQSGESNVDNGITPGPALPPGVTTPPPQE